MKPSADARADEHGLLWLPSCRSTNDEAWARLSEPGLRAVAAGAQTAGRGRRGRRWFSPPDTGLYLSWIAWPRFGQSLGGALPLLAAAAVAETVAALGVKPTLKWPNDLLVDGRKLAGVLCEARGTPEAWTAVVGIGLNRRTPPGGWPADIPAVALDAAGVDPSERPDGRALAIRLIGALTRWLDRVEQHGLAPVIEAWHRHAPPPGTRMRQGEVDGTFAGLAPDGALRLSTSAGLRTIHAGEVEMITTLS